MEVINLKLKTPFLTCKLCQWVMPHPNSNGWYLTLKTNTHLKECTAYLELNKKKINELLAEQTQRPDM
jgi:hypothetical protein